MPGTTRKARKASGPAQVGPDDPGSACCKMCGIGEAETRLLVPCRVVRVDVCDPCCVSVGGPHHDVCKTCPNGKPYWDSMSGEPAAEPAADWELTPYA